MRRRSATEKGLALALAVAVLVASTARVLLDASVPDDRVHVEATHDPARCGYLHDHAACQQIFASAASPAAGAPAPVRLPPLTDRIAETAKEPADRRTPSPSLPRAPPHLGS